MLHLLRRWPPLAWIGVALGSLLVSMGMQRLPLLLAGIVVMVLSLALGLYLVLRPEPGVASPRPFVPALVFVAAFYVICAIFAGILLGADHALVALLSGVVPLTAVALVTATARRRTRDADGHLVDASKDDRSPFPGLGADDERPLGDTPEAHDEIIPQDLPRDHPGRIEAERQAAAGDGTTRGHREGGAAGVGGSPRQTSDEVLEGDERDGARLRR